MVPDEEAGQEELEETSGENKNKDMFIHKDIYLEDRPGDLSFVKEQHKYMKGKEINKDEDMPRKQNAVNGSWKLKVPRRYKTRKRCRFFDNPKNPCKNGTNCKYEHNKRKKLCWFYLNTYCWFKDHCWNIHGKKEPSYEQKRDSRKAKRKEIKMREIKKIKSEIRKLKEIMAIGLEKMESVTAVSSTERIDGKTRTEKEEREKQAPLEEKGLKHKSLSSQSNVNTPRKEDLKSKEHGKEELIKSKTTGENSKRELLDKSVKDERSKVSHTKEASIESSHIEEISTSMPGKECTPIELSDKSVPTDPSSIKMPRKQKKIWMQENESPDPKKKFIQRHQEQLLSQEEDRLTSISEQISESSHKESTEDKIKEGQESVQQESDNDMKQLSAEILDQIFSIQELSENIFLKFKVVNPFRGI